MGCLASQSRRTEPAAAVVREWYFLSMLTVPPMPGNDDQRYPDARPAGLPD